MRSLALFLLALLPEVLVANLVQVDQVSDPVGFLSHITAIEVGETITTNQPPLAQDGYVFGYWSSESGRLSDANGQSSISPTVVVEDTLVLTAHYFPENEDLDSDGLPDWYEYRNFGDLLKKASDDPDQDGYSILVEKQLGQETIIPDLVEDGGISFASSNLVTYTDFNVLTYSSRSDPQGLIDPVSGAYTAETVVSSPTLNGETEGYYFAYWSLNGVRQENPSGVALNQVEFKLTTNSELIAHFLPTGQDDDGDGLVDWYEIYQFGDLNQDGGSDPDSDGFTNDEEIKLGQAPMILDLVEDGGLSFASSTTVSFVSDNLLAYSIDSEPTGFSEKLSGASAVGNLISTPTLYGEKNGYHFAYWSLNGIRQASSSGAALNQVNLQLSENSVLVAHFIPSDQDSDADGLMDWFELNQFGNLDQDATGDPDGDSFDNQKENILGQEATISDQVEDGGISFASSGNAFYFVQSYDRLDGLELNNTQTFALKPAGESVGRFSAVDTKSLDGGGRYNYRLVSGEGSADNQKFTIEGDHLKTASTLIIGSYSIRARVANHLNISYEKTFKINAIQDPATINTAPRITSFAGEPSVEISLSENQRFVAVIMAEDDENDPLVFSIAEGKDAENFSVGLSDGKLEFLINPDFEYPRDTDGDNLYSVAVSCSDGELQVQQEFIITIEDIEEDSGIQEFELSPSSLLENEPAGSQIGTFSAALEDASLSSVNIAYSLESGSGDSGNQYVKLSGDVLSATQSFDYETDRSFSVRVKVSASNGASQTKTFMIELEDVFENRPPRFTSFDGLEIGRLSISENQSFAAQVRASDPDAQSLVYLLTEEKDHNLFNLSSATGLLRFENPPDFEKPGDSNQDNQYEVSILASDGLTYDKQSLIISILDDPDEDTDGDGLTDRQEKILGTDPNTRDTDEDGHEDGEEVNQETNPLDPEDYPGVYRGFDFSTLLLLDQNNDFQGKTSEVEFSAVAGQTYYFAVDGAKQARGIAKIGYRYQRRQGMVTGSSAPISLADEIIDLQNVFEGDGYSWISPKDGIVTISADREAITGMTLQVFKDLGEGRSKLVNASFTEDFSSLQFSGIAGEIFILKAIGLEDDSASGQSLSVDIQGNENQPVNDLFSNRILLEGVNNNVSGTLSGAGSELGEPLHALLPPPQRSIWWKWQAPTDGTLVIDTSGGGFPAIPKVYAGFAIDDLVPIEIQKSEMDDQQLTLKVEKAVDYAIVVSGYGENKGAIQLSLSLSGEEETSRPANDDFLNAKEITGSEIQSVGTNVLATGEDIEPMHGDTSAPTHSVWWKWKPENEGYTVISTEGSDFDTTLGLYSGSSLANLQILGLNDDDENSRTSRLEFLAVPETTYYFAVDGFEHAMGEILLNLDQSEGGNLIPENDDIANSISIPAINQVLTGSNHWATASLSDQNHPGTALPHHSLWWDWTADFSGAVSFDTIGSSFDTTLAVYEGNTVSELTLIAESDDFFGSSSLTVFNASQGKKYFLMVDGKGNSKGYIRLKGRDLRKLVSSLSSEEVKSAFLANTDNTLIPPQLESIHSSTGSVQYKISDNFDGGSYHLSSWLIQPWEWTEGGETLDGVSWTSQNDRASIQSLFRHSGQKAFQLSADQSDGSWLILDRWFYFTEKSSINWREYFDQSLDQPMASLEFSTDGEASWTPIQQEKPVQTSIFEKKSLSLSDLNGVAAKIRFHLSAPNSGSNENSVLSWYLDDISFENTYHLSEPISQTVSNEVFSFANRNRSNSVFSIEKLSSDHAYIFSMPLFGSSSEENQLVSFLGQSSTFDNDWKSSSWYGPYFSLEESLWFYTPVLGWQFFGGYTVGGAWIYDTEMGWLWTNQTIYPWLYQNDQEVWVYDYSQSLGNRTFKTYEE